MDRKIVLTIGMLHNNNVVLDAIKKEIYDGARDNRGLRRPNDVYATAKREFRGRAEDILL